MSYECLEATIFRYSVLFKPVPPLCFNYTTKASRCQVRAQMELPLLLCRHLPALEHTSIYESNEYS